MSDIIFITIAAVICGAETWNDIESFGKRKENWLRLHLDLPGGIPSHDTFNRFFSHLDSEELEGCFLLWVKAVSEITFGEVISIDEKTIRGAKEFTKEDRKQYRIENALPIINELGKFISEQNKKVLSKNPIGKAFNYAINRWDALQDYLYDGNLLIDNNRIENTIRPNAPGRKNWLFAGSHNGAQRSAMFYSFFGTCKLNGVDPNQWMTYVLENIADHKVNKLHELFPQNFIPKSKV